MRAKVINLCIEICAPQDMIVLLGGPQGNNREKTSTLAYRYARKYVNFSNLLKNPGGQLPGSIIESIIVAQAATGFENYGVYLASTGRDVYNNSQFVKICRRGGFENIPLNEIQFLSPFGEN
jgi:hypothetical protein